MIASGKSLFWRIFMRTKIIIVIIRINHVIIFNNLALLNFFLSSTVYSYLLSSGFAISAQKFV